jgi:hypothetical protein
LIYGLEIEIEKRQPANSRPLFAWAIRRGVDEMRVSGLAPSLTVGAQFNRAARRYLTLDSAAA